MPTAPSLPLGHYYRMAVRRFAGTVMSFPAKLGRSAVTTHWDDVTAYVNSYVPDLPSLNRYLSKLTRYELRAVVGYFGLDDGSSKTIHYVARRYGVSDEAIRRQVIKALSRLHRTVSVPSRP